MGNVCVKVGNRPGRSPPSEAQEGVLVRIYVNTRRNCLNMKTFRVLVIFYLPKFSYKHRMCNPLSINGVTELAHTEKLV